MAPYSEVLHKCLLPVNGVPTVRWIVEDILFQCGWREKNIILCINKKFERHFKHEFRDLLISFSITEEPTGTGDEVLSVRKYLDETFILRYGDDLTKINYNLLLELHKTKNALITLGLTNRVRLSVGIVEIDDDKRVIKMDEKPYIDRNVWAGVAVMEPEVLTILNENEDIARDLIPNIIRSHPDRVFGYVFSENWYDVGNLTHWRRADEAYREKFEEGDL